ncbi:oxidoreductase [Paucilactobacillus wasatchensis]|uniref:Oxidoreductase n=2 Tax=Paucilactobacillus wasatchensis TaxID=1335616 RepID=A0A0D1A4K2_9LACO|nr:oxidoreductase [Paucilactobacillus wasatchensis]
MAGGNPSKIDPVSLLSESKSLLTGDLWDYLTTQPSRQMRFNRLLKYVLAGDLDLAKPKVYALSAGYEAHRLMESGKSVGKIVLKP